MTFVMIYGASGVGKESIGKELSARKNWPLVPQHLAFDLAHAVIGFGNQGFESYQRELCISVFERLINSSVDGIIFTYCYVKPHSDSFVNTLVRLFKEHQVETKFIHVSCKYEKHLQRVRSEGRKNTNKIQSKDYLDSYLKKFDFSSELPNQKSFLLGTTELTAEESATKIDWYLSNN